MTDSDETSEGGSQLDRSVERSFTCPLCGFAMTHEVPLLQWEVGSVCHNCGDWTAQTASLDEMVAAARTAADALAGDVLTERQALAYLLRDVLGVDRQATAEAMDSTPSNVDNLQRRGSEKVAAARNLVDGLDELTPTDEADDADDAGDDSDLSDDDRRHRPV